MRVIVVVTFASIFAAGSVHAQSLITAPTSSVYVAPPVYNGSFSNKLGDTSVTGPYWHVVQWSSPGPLIAGSNYSAQPGSSWAFSTNSTRVQYYNKNGGSFGTTLIPPYTYELAQSSGNPAAPLPCGAEYDLFLEATSPGIYKTPSGAPAPSAFQASKPLNQVTNVRLQFDFTIPYEAILSNRCPTTYVGYVIGLTLNSINGYAMFYQLFLRDSRFYSQNNSTCTGYPTGKTYCFSTTMDQFDPTISWQYPGGYAKHFDLNAFNSIKNAINLTPDKNAADWKVNGMYFGELMEGDVNPVSQWTNMNVSAY